MPVNAKDELIKYLRNREILAAQLHRVQDMKTISRFSLPIGGDVQDLFHYLDFEYEHRDDWAQNLFGVIWLTDDSWLERVPSNGAEWWERRVKPQIPEELK